MSEQYKPTGENMKMARLNYTHIRLEHGGLKQDGTPDKRVGTGGSS